MSRTRNILQDGRYVQFVERYYDNLLLYVLENASVCPTWQQAEFLDACSKPGARVAVSSGHGCFGKGTPILLHDGTIKPAEDIRTGDLLMGDDTTPRTVGKLHRGRENLYRFEYVDGTRHVFNESHILCLMHLHDRTTLETTVRDYLSWTADKRTVYAGYRAGSRSIHPLPIWEVTPLGEGAYYGFELDGNRRFLSGDFTVLHNTGKSWCLAWLLDWNLRCFPMSNAVLTATNIEQARSVVWKYLDGVIETIEKVYPWQRDMFIKETRRYYAAGFKDAWYVLPKTASKANPENLAGQHNENLLIVVDEASGVPDAIHEVLRGALTGPRNRYVMTSQPTRPSGYFWEAMNKLNKPQANGIYDAIYMNSEESPIVSREFIKNALIEYGGHSSPEYQIRVLGTFPDNLSGFLIPRHWVMGCMDAKVDINTGDWGYALLCDVAEGVHRDSSVAHLVKICGFGKERKVVSLQCDEFLDMNEKEFARYIASIYNQYPNLTVAVDADGAGRAVVLDLEDVGIPVTHIHWGLPCHAEADKRRYANLRAYAHYKLREAIFEGRFRGPRLKKFVEQASRLPYSINERGQYVMETKERMKADGIKSPDISDTCCFCFLIDYVPADAGNMPQKDNWRREIAASLGDEDAFLDFGSKTKQ